MVIAFLDLWPLSLLAILAMVAIELDKHLQRRKVDAKRNTSVLLIADRLSPHVLYVLHNQKKLHIGNVLVATNNLAVIDGIFEPNVQSLYMGTDPIHPRRWLSEQQYNCDIVLVMHWERSEDISDLAAFYPPGWVVQMCLEANHVLFLTFHGDTTVVLLEHPLGGKSHSSHAIKKSLGEIFRAVYRATNRIDNTARVSSG